MVHASRTAQITDRVEASLATIFARATSSNITSRHTSQKKPSQKKLSQVEQTHLRLRLAPVDVVPRHQPGGAERGGERAVDPVHELRTGHLLPRRAPRVAETARGTRNLPSARPAVTRGGGGGRRRNPRRARPAGRARGKRRVLLGRRVGRFRFDSAFRAFRQRAPSLAVRAPRRPRGEAELARARTGPKICCVIPAVTVSLSTRTRPSKPAATMRSIAVLGASRASGTIGGFWF